ncbi:hypothetical protein OKW21_005601 [Catalinimonas alkaloidigena]|uniref:hypothetical protein n=1 Tax=Catalinimonas alkaloidigena TaxID=1075417 RepID=UPI002405E614|nr:hypothetical protein [Catalinimonas alkaloidigena]MDF9800338.1 hypothetical protein [Catalinimonas alkaloidigena]
MCLIPNSWSYDSGPDTGVPPYYTMWISEVGFTLILTEKIAQGRIGGIYIFEEMKKLLHRELQKQLSLRLKLSEEGTQWINH